MKLAVVIIPHVLFHQFLYVDLDVAKELDALVHVLEIQHVGVVEVYDNQFVAFDFFLYLLVG